MTNIKERTGRGGIDLMMAVVAVLATAACGDRAVNTGPRGTGGDAANGNTTGAGGAGGDGSAADGGDYPTCPRPFNASGACAVESLVCAPPFECRHCVGGFKLETRRPSFPCVCRAGRWNCPPLISSEVSDCFVDEPLSCEDARDVYLDPDCTEHAPCSP